MLPKCEETPYMCALITLYKSNQSPASQSLIQPFVLFSPVVILLNCNTWGIISCLVLIYYSFCDLTTSSVHFTAVSPEMSPLREK